MIVAELFAKLGLIPDHKSWEQGHELIESLHHALEAYLGYEGLKKVGELVEGTVEAAVSAKHLGERLGITGEAVQELGYAADVTGASAGELTSAMQRLAFGMENARRTGSGPVVDAMSKLHLNFQKLSKEPLDQRLEDIADGFVKAGPNVDKLALSIELFGRNAGPKLLPLLMKGKEGMEELRNEAQKLGVVIDEEGIEKAEEFEIAQKKMTATLKGLRNEAVIAVLPALQEMAEGLQEWIQANREAIVSTLTAVLKGVAFAFHLVGMVISTVIDVVKLLSDHLDYLIPIISGLAAVVLPFFVEWAGAALIAAGATIAAAAPFILIGLAVTGVTLAIIKLYQHWREIWGAIKSKAQEFADWFEALPEKVTEWVEDIAETIKDAFEDAWNFVVNKANEAWDKVKSSPLGRLATGLGNAAGFVVRKVGGGGEDYDSIDNVASADDRPSIAVGGGGGNTAITGDINIKVDGNGTADPNELAAKIKDAVQESQQDMLRQAHNNLSGGKR